MKFAITSILITRSFSIVETYRNNRVLYFKNDSIQFLATSFAQSLLRPSCPYIIEHTPKNESMPDFYSISQYFISSSIFSTMRFCSARGGTGKSVEIIFSFDILGCAPPSALFVKLSLFAIKK